MVLHPDPHLPKRVRVAASVGVLVEHVDVSVAVLPVPRYRLSGKTRDLRAATPDSADLEVHAVGVEDELPGRLVHIEPIRAGYERVDVGLTGQQLLERVEVERRILVELRVVVVSALLVVR